MHNSIPNEKSSSKKKIIYSIIEDKIYKNIKIYLFNYN